MRAALAVFRLHAGASLALILHVGVCVGCAPPVRGPLAGASDAWANNTKEAERPAAPPGPAWDAYTEVQHWPALNAAPFTSRGHQPTQQVDVRVSPEIRASYLALVSDTVFPDGSVLAELAHRGGGPGYAMRKTGTSWSFFELDAAGAVLASGALSLCAGCHAQAPSDGVFGLPREPPAAP